MAYDRRQTDVGPPREGGAGPYRDYRFEVGRAEVPVGVPRTFKVLDPQRAASLRGWVECLVPAQRGRPSAAEVGAAKYIDATVYSASGLRETLLRAIDRLQALVGGAGGGGFAAAGLGDRTPGAPAFEVEDRSRAFSLDRAVHVEDYDTTHALQSAHPLH